jgi:hypothetical protein
MLARRENPAIAWSYAWQEIAGVAGAGHADRLVVALGAFINSVESAAARRIEVLPKGCPGLCVVVFCSSLEGGACPALKACVFALIDSGNVEPCIRSAGLFSTALSEAGQTLPPDVVCNALALMAGSSGRMFADA